MLPPTRREWNRRKTTWRPLGQLLIELGLITTSDLGKVLAEQRRSGRTLGDNDLVCGGAGKDALRGGSGKDVLRGGAGRDRLLGGPEHDSQHQ